MARIFHLGAAIEFDKVKEKVLKLSRDVKMKERFGGKQIYLNDRQVKLVEYIQEVGYLQNQSFGTVIQDVSEDTILRDIQDLIKKILSKSWKHKGCSLCNGLEFYMKFSVFAKHLEEIENVSSRNEITRLLANLFKLLQADEIGMGLYLMQGRVAPLYESVEFGVAEKSVAKSAVSAMNIEKNTLTQSLEK